MVKVNLNQLNWFASNELLPKPPWALQSAVFCRGDTVHCLSMAAWRLPVTLQVRRVHTLYLSLLSSPCRPLHPVFVWANPPAAICHKQMLRRTMTSESGRPKLGATSDWKPAELREVTVKVSNTSSSWVPRLANLPWQSRKSNRTRESSLNGTVQTLTEQRWGRSGTDFERWYLMSLLKPCRTHFCTKCRLQTS